MRRKTTSHRVERVDSWQEFLRWIVDSPYSNWAFRGVSDATLPLETPLSRYLNVFAVDARAWAAQEQRVLRVFKRKAHQFLTHIPDQGDHLQWLALMEHHGSHLVAVRRSVLRVAEGGDRCIGLGDRSQRGRSSRVA